MRQRELRPETRRRPNNIVVNVVGVDVNVDGHIVAKLNEYTDYTRKQGLVREIPFIQLIREKPTTCPSSNPTHLF